MKTFLDAASAFAKAFVVVALAAAIGLLSMPNYDGVGARALAAGCAALAAGLAAVQTFVPQLSVRYWIAEPLGSALDAGIHAGLSVFLVLVTGWLNSPDFSAWHSFVTGLAVAVGGAFLRALQGALFGEHALPVPRKTGAVRADARAAGSPSGVVLALA